MKKLLYITLLLLLPAPVLAGNLLVLVHGYAAHAGTWEYSGINRLLLANGWQHVASAQAADNLFYVAQLPAQAPLTFQAGVLLSQLQALRAQYPDRQLTLAGHSAGGVVARLVVLNGNPAGVSRLVTIASPNLGTPRAAQGLDIVEDKPLFCPGPGWYSMKSFLAAVATVIWKTPKGRSTRCYRRGLARSLPASISSHTRILNIIPSCASTEICWSRRTARI
jgi:pimeloyl-ACP methyl ester carboxylesterase